VASYLDGTATLILLGSGEAYTINFPSAYGRGILFGTLLMELCGEVNIVCHQTHCKAELEFKGKPFFGGEYNCITGKIRRRKDAVYSISGKWDDRMDITNIKAKQTEVLFDSKAAKRVPKVVRTLDQQEEVESQKLWLSVTNAIKKRDQREATAEKTRLEEVQRKERKERTDEWVPRLFKKNASGEWTYRYINLSVYSPEEKDQEEEDGIVYYTGTGKQQVIDKEEENFEKYTTEMSNNVPREEKKPSRSFSSNFLKGYYE